MLRQISEENVPLVKKKKQRKDEHENKDKDDNSSNVVTAEPMVRLKLAAASF